MRSARIVGDDAPAFDALMAAIPTVETEINRQP